MKKTLIILVSILVLISPKLVDALSLSKDTAELEVGKTLKLEVKDLEDGQTVTWLSENGDIASVSDDGTVDNRSNTNILNMYIPQIMALIKRSRMVKSISFPVIL